MKRLDKNTWFIEGLSILRETGAVGLTIENLTKRLNKTKGSFYHHFKSRNHYTEKLLQHWEKEKTLEVVDISSKGKTFSEINSMLFKLSEQNHDPELEVAIRAWALRDPLVKVFQKRIDEQRVNFLKEMFGLLTKDPEKTELMAVIRYCFYIGTQQIIPGLSNEKYKIISGSLQKMFDKFSALSG